MTKTIHPVDAIAGAPSYSGRMLRQVGSVAFAGATAARPLGARSGVRPGTSATTVTATSTTWTVDPHAGVLDFEAASESGPTLYAVDAAVSGSVTAAHATLARVDIVWVRQDIPVEDGSSAPDVIPGYTANPSAGTGLPPAAPARCMVLAWINVPASGGGSPTVQWKAPYCAAAGVLDPAVTATGGASGPITNVWVALATAPAVTGDGVKKFLITFTYKEAYSTVAGDVCEFAIRNGTGGATEDHTVGPYQAVPLTTIWANGRTLSVFDTPAAGAVTYTACAFRAGGTGTITVNPSQIIVQQIA